MKKLISVFLLLFLSATGVLAFEPNLDITGDIVVSWESATLNSYPITYGLSNSNANVDLELDLSKKIDNTKLGLDLFINPVNQDRDLITKVSYNEDIIPPEAINIDGPYEDANGLEYWTYQYYDTGIKLNGYGYIELDYDDFYIKAQSNCFTDHIDSNLLHGYGFNKSAGFRSVIKSIPNANIILSCNNGDNNKTNALLQGEYFNSPNEVGDLAGGVGVQFGDKEAFGAWGNILFPKYNASLTAEYGIQKDLSAVSAVGIFINYDGFINSNLSIITQDHGFISAGEDTVIYGTKIKDDDSEEIVLGAAFRKLGYQGVLVSFDSSLYVTDNINLGLLLNAVGGTFVDDNFNTNGDKFSYKVNVSSKLTEDLSLDFWYAGWGNRNITSFEGKLYFNDNINLSISYKIKELYDFHNVFSIGLNGKL